MRWGEQEGFSTLQVPSRKHLAQVLLEAREILPSHSTMQPLDSQAMGRLGFPGFPPSLPLVSIILFRSPSSRVPTAQDAWAFLLIRAPRWASGDLPLWIPELCGGDYPKLQAGIPTGLASEIPRASGIGSSGYTTQSGTVRPNVGFLKG